MKIIELAIRDNLCQVTAGRNWIPCWTARDDRHHVWQRCFRGSKEKGEGGEEGDRREQEAVQRNGGADEQVLPAFGGCQEQVQGRPQRYGNRLDHV